MGERLVVRWSLSKNMGTTFLIVLLAVFCLFTAGASGAPVVRGLVAIVAMVPIGARWWWILRRRLVLTPHQLDVVEPTRRRSVQWDDVCAVSWRSVADRYTGIGWVPDLRMQGGRTATATAPVLVPEGWVSDVNNWLREHQPEIRIDPVAPWRDRFGTWHVAEPGYDPVETMMSVRRSLVGPWEIVARSCDGGFRAEQRMVKSGVLVHVGAVHETMGAAREDGVRVVREAVVAAESAAE